mgnify:CR=1 FL=1
MPPAAPPPHPFVHYDFSEGSNGFVETPGWSTAQHLDTVPREFPWRRATTSMHGLANRRTGPKGPVFGTGYYLFAGGRGELDVASGAAKGSVYRLSYDGAECTETGMVGSVRFFYHMRGNHMGALELEQTTDGMSWTAIWVKWGDQGNSWQGATVSITTPNVIRVRWVGTTGSNFKSCLLYTSPSPRDRG